MKYLLIALLFFSNNIFAQSIGEDFARIRNSNTLAYEQSEFISINKKIPLLPGNPSLEQLSDTSKPNKVEKEAIYKLSNLLSKGSEDADAIYRKYFSPTSFVMAINENRRQARADDQDLFIQLVSDKLTFGEFNKLRRDKNIKYSTKQQEIMNSRANYQ